MTCKKCGRTNLTTADFHRTSAGRLRGSCKQCKARYDRERKATMPMPARKTGRSRDWVETELRKPSAGPFDYHLGLPSRMFDAQVWRAL